MFFSGYSLIFRHIHNAVTLVLRIQCRFSGFIIRLLCNFYKKSTLNSCKSLTGNPAGRLNSGMPVCRFKCRHSFFIGLSAGRPLLPAGTISIHMEAKICACGPGSGVSPGLSAYAAAQFAWRLCGNGFYEAQAIPPIFLFWF